MIAVSVLGLRFLLWSDEFVGHLQNRLRAAEVLGKNNGPGTGKVAFEVEDVADVGSPPFIDRLIRVAHHAQVRVILRQPAGDGVLGLVRVLVFVDQDVAKASVEFGPQLRVVFQCQCGPKEQIVEIEGVGGSHLLFVDLVDLGDDLAEKVVGIVGVLVRRQQLVLGLADGPLDGLRCEANIVDVRGFQGRFDHADPIGLIVNGEVAFQADPIGVGAQQADAEAVEGAEPDALAGHESLDALAHFLGRLVGEGDGQDLIRPDPLLDEVSDAPRDDARLAAAGPGQDEQRTIGVQHGFALGWCQIGQVVVRSRNGTRHAIPQRRWAEWFSFRKSSGLAGKRKGPTFRARALAREAREILASARALALFFTSLLTRPLW